MQLEKFMAESFTIKCSIFHNIMCVHIIIYYIYLIPIYIYGGGGGGGQPIFAELAIPTPKISNRKFIIGKNLQK